MSINKVKTQIDQFLKSDFPEVIALRGSWGVGKTHFWKKTLLQAQKEQKINFKKYSYISLFGISSIDDLRFAIFEQMIHMELIGKEPSLDTFRSNTDALLETLKAPTESFWAVIWRKIKELRFKELCKFAWRKIIASFNGISIWKNFSPIIIKSLSFLSLHQVLICIDDVERKNKDLQLIDIMGLITTLKEQKKCKLVLIFDDEMLLQNEEEKDNYQLLREKCIDVQMSFDPTAEESLEIAQIDIGQYTSILKQYIHNLSINNIRIIKKIERVADKICSSLQGFEEKVVNNALHSLTLISFCYYDQNKSPSIDYVKSRKIDPLLFPGLEEIDSNDNSKPEWEAILHKYGYSSTDEFDLQIFEIVEAGFINDDSFLKEAIKLNNQVKATNSIDFFRDTWQLYHNSFDNNEKEIVDNLQNCFSNQHIQYIPPKGLDAAVRLFRYLEKDDIAEEIIGKYIKARKSELEIFDLSGFQNEGITDEKVISEFNQIYMTNKPSRTIKDILEALIGNGGWDDDDIKCLAETTPDEYLIFFKTEKGDRLSLYIRRCLEFRNRTNPSENHKKIVQNVTEALKQIAQESRLNKRRVKQLGINPNE